MIYRIVHNTTYEYVDACRDMPQLVATRSPHAAGQSCLETSLSIEPATGQGPRVPRLFRQPGAQLSRCSSRIDKLSITRKAGVEVDRSDRCADRVESPGLEFVAARGDERSRRGHDRCSEYVYDSVYIRAGQRLAIMRVPVFPSGGRSSRRRMT